LERSDEQDRFPNRLVGEYLPQCDRSYALVCERIQRAAFLRRKHGGANTVTVTMTGAPAVFLEARAYEYAGIAATSSLDTVRRATGLLPPSANSLSAGSGFTGRPVADGGRI
jgi:hypothetical protein